MAEIATSEWTCGACPVQIEGTLTDGRRFYFRYRYRHATLAAGEYPQGCCQPQDGVDVVSRAFPEKDEMDGSLGGIEALELLTSMAAELPAPT